jgi:hypothetical protein
LVGGGDALAGAARARRRLSDAMKRSRAAATRRQAPQPQQNISHVLRALADAEAAIPTLQEGGGGGGQHPEGGAGAAPHDAPSGSRSPQGALMRAYPRARAALHSLCAPSLHPSTLAALPLLFSACAQPGRGQVCLPRWRALAQRAAR